MKSIFWLSLVLGLWLVASPYLIGYGPLNAVATGNNMLVGILIVVCSIWTLVGGKGLAGVSAFQALTSIWLIVAPFALQFRALPHVLANDATVGIIVLLISLGEEWSLGHRHVPLQI